MPDDKTKDQLEEEIRGYNRGYHDGVTGKKYPAGFMEVAMSVLGGPLPSEDYDKGFKEGKEDRERNRDK